MDIVANSGYTWVKVIARKPAALLSCAAGKGEYGSRSIIDVAEDFLNASKLNKKDYTMPFVVFYFDAGVADVLAKYLISIGIVVCSSDSNAHLNWADLSLQPSDYQDEHAADFLDIYDLESTLRMDNIKLSDNLASKNNLEQAFYLSCCCASLNEISNQVKVLRYDSKLSDTKQEPAIHNFSSIKEANLDVSTLLSLVSNLTNGCGTFKYSSKVLNDHAIQEKENPVLPVLKMFLKEKKLIACETAISSFNEIVKIIAGPEEKKRADDLLKRITIVKDSPSERCLALQTSSQIRKRAIVSCVILIN